MTDGNTSGTNGTTCAENALMPYPSCSECKERQGYYLDAETIQRQQEHIAELEAENRWQSAYLYMTTGANDKLEDLVLDLYCQLLNAYDAKELGEFVERMKELGIEVRDEEGMDVRRKHAPDGAGRRP